MVVPVPKLIADLARPLEKAGIMEARVEIEWILCHVLDVDRLNLYLHGAELLTEERLSRAKEIVEHRTSRYPLQYILEESWFYGRKFYVSPAVMVPTPETEQLCQRAIDFIKRSKADPARALDIGTGSGVIAVTLAAELPEISLLALDVSEDALNVARRNARAYDLSAKISFRQSDFFSSLDRDDKFDLIISNPPYICEPDYSGLPPEVKADPKIALTAGEDGMDAIRAILRDAPGHLTDNGRIMFEIGFDQAAKVAALTEKDDRYRGIDIIRDLNNIDRIVILDC